MTRPAPPERVPVEDLIRRWRYFTEGIQGGDVDAGDALAAALEATAAERDRAHERLRLAQSGWAHYRDGQTAKGTRLLDAALRECP